MDKLEIKARVVNLPVHLDNDQVEAIVDLIYELFTPKPSEGSLLTKQVAEILRVTKGAGDSEWVAAQLIGQLNLVQLSDNQELPRDKLVNAKLVDSKRMVYEADDGNFHCTAEYLSNYLEGYERAQQVMLGEDFRKVKGVK